MEVMFRSCKKLIITKSGEMQMEALEKLLGL